MHWTVPGVGAITALRRPEATSQWETIRRNQDNRAPAA
jgi:hypothetical protein